MRCGLALLAVLGIASAAAAGDGEGCGVCHGAERIQHARSIHRSGGLGCVACHGGDPGHVESKEAAHSREKGFVGRIPRGEIAASCGSCHADVVKMRPFGLRADVLDAWRSSHHGRAVLEEGRTDAATCIDCHGVHEVLRTRDPASPAHRTRVPATCGKCHADPALMESHGKTATAPAEFARSLHGTRLATGEPGVPSCADCHDAHAAAPPGALEVAAVCGSCHLEAQEHFRESPHFAASLRGEMAQCITCHGNHAVDHPDFDLFDRENGKDGKGPVRCLDCHDGSDPGDAGAATARAFGSGLRGTTEAIAAAEVRIAEVAALGFFVDDEREALEQARREVVRALPLAHAVQRIPVEASLRRARSFVDEALLGCDTSVRESRDRRIQGTFLAFALLAVAAFFFLEGRRRNRP